MTSPFSGASLGFLIISPSLFRRHGGSAPMVPDIQVNDEAHECDAKQRNDSSVNGVHFLTPRLVRYQTMNHPNTEGVGHV